VFLEQDPSNGFSPADIGVSGNNGERGLLDFVRFVRATL
jgi:hypothetical protein